MKRKSREQGLISRKYIATHTNYFFKFKLAFTLLQMWEWYIHRAFTYKHLIPGLSADT